MPTWLKRLLGRSSDLPEQVLVVEPHLARWRGNVYVKGPYPPRKAYRVARRLIRKLPWGEIEVLDASATVTVDGQVLWPRNNPTGALTVSHEAGALS